MILVFDIGNTNITIGCYDNDRLVFVSRMHTTRQKTGDEFAVSLLDIFKHHGVNSSDFSGVALSSVVPEVTAEVKKAIMLTVKKEPITVGKKYNGGLKSEYIKPEHIGPDLISDCIGALKKYPMPCLVVDLGTASKILVLDKSGGFVGCTIAPGVKISLDALSAGTSLLPSISFSKPEKVFSVDTVECMQSGTVYGTAAMIDGMTRRILNELGYDSATVVATGGYSGGIVPCCETPIIYDENLLLDGLKAIYDDAVKETGGKQQ